MIDYCSSLEPPISRAFLHRFITRTSLCNNIQYITDVPHASRVSEWRNDCFMSSPIASLVETSQGMSKTFFRNKKSVTQNDEKEIFLRSYLWK